MQWVRIRDLRAVKSACPAYTKRYIFPTTDKIICVVKSACFGLVSRGALNSGYPLHAFFFLCVCVFGKFGS